MLDHDHAYAPAVSSTAILYNMREYWMNEAQIARNRSMIAWMIDGAGKALRIQ
jgi:hypothetical protein